MIGQTVSHYRVLEKLGEGGMGVVYVAEDINLGRRVAIKFLTAYSDHQYRARFLREARAISALSHPNIATIHEYGETESDKPFIVMELIKGKTLGDLLQASALTLTRAIEIIETVAQALGVAHKHGIVHRDIKPSNVLVSENGGVKVVDFGLAKLINQEHQLAASPDAETLLGTRTRSDVVVGTPLYLSPEQAMSTPVDARSDIFSLGALLYECITGKPAFAGGNVLEIGAQIIHFDPPAPSAVNSRVPSELDQITLKALAKKPEARYQSAEEIAEALRALRATLQSGSGHRTMRLSKALRGEHSSAFKSISETLRRPRLSIAFFLLTLFVVGLVLWALLPIFRSQPLAKRLLQVTEVSKITNAGNSVCAAISPDGKYIAYVTADGEAQTLLLSSIATSSSVTVAPPEDVRYLGITFSPDGEYLYYVRYEKTDVGKLYQVPTLGGSARKLFDGVDGRVAFSPDGKRIAFVRFDKSQGEYSLMVAASDGTMKRRLVGRGRGEYLSQEGQAWSSDGKKIIFAAGKWAGGYHMNLFEVGADDGTERALPSQRWFLILQMAWLEDGSGIIVNAAQQPTSPLQIWQVSYPDGKAEKLTSDLNDYDGVSLPRDGRTIVSVQSSHLKKIWVSQEGQTENARQIVSLVGPSYGLTWTPDGKIVFSSMAGGNLNISVINSDGSDKKQLTQNAGDNYHPAVSADGRYILFASSKSGTFNIWRMNVDDGGDLKQLTHGGSDFNPAPSPDGQWVVFEHLSEGAPTLLKVPIDGGDPLTVTDKYGSAPVVSPDGKFIACRYYISADLKGIAVIPFEGGEPVKLLPIPIIEWQRVRWTPDGKALTYVNVTGGVYNIWSQALEGGLPKQLTYFKTDQIFSYDWSADNKALACERGTAISDVVAMEISR